MPSDTLHTVTADLRALGGGRVWSLMVSLFGDLAQGKGDKINGPVLSAIMAALDVKPEAARVALHRLRNDGWISSAKQGRISQHSLTAHGRRESAVASPRIYALPEAGDTAWQLVLLPSAETNVQGTSSGTGLIALTPRVYVGAVDVPVPEGALVFPGAEVPKWLSQQVAPSALDGDYVKLRAALQSTADALEEFNPLSPLQTAVLRCLVVHNWRRLVLKHPQIPRAFVDPKSAYHQCHLLVASLLAQHPRPMLADIA